MSVALVLKFVMFVHKNVENTKIWNTASSVPRSVDGARKNVVR
jgi:hypothetical protein